MSSDGRIGEIISAWRARRDQGELVEPEAVICEHPDLADGLRRAFAALAILDRAVAGVLPPSVPASTVTDGIDGSSGIPERIGDFLLIRKIGCGATGNVYEAEQTSMRRRVALKILHPSMTLSPKAVERFRREAQTAGRLHHTHIVPVYAMGTDRGLSWFAMEVIDGQPLSDVIADLRRLAVPPRDPAGVQPSDDAPADASTGFGTESGRREFYERVARAFAGVADALAAAHAARVVHRDVKPSNLLLDSDGTLKLLDFGLARAQEDGAPALTLTGDVIGTPSYMSPEQVRNDGVDGKTDVYGVGATLYEVLTLAPPFQGTDITACLAKIVSREPVAPRKRNPRIPKDLETIVLKAMEKLPFRRYAGAAELCADLTAFADGATIRARRVGPVGRAWRYARRHRARVALVSGFVFALGAAALLAVSAARSDAARERETARRIDVEYRELLARATVGGRRGETLAVTTQHVPTPIETAIRLAPGRPDAWYLRALVSEAPQQARLADLDAAHDRGLPAETYRLARSIVLREYGRHEDAVAEEALAATAPSDDPRALVLRAEIAAFEGHGPEAERILDALVARRSIDDNVLVRALWLRGEVRRSREDYEGAIGDLMALRGSLSSDVTAPRADARIAGLWRRLGRPDAAERHIDVVLAGYDHLSRAQNYADFAAALWRSEGDPKGAHRVVEAGIRRFPSDDGLLIARLVMLPPADLIAEADRVLQVEQRSIDIRDEVEVKKAGALLDLERAAEALAIYDRFLSRRPDSPAVQARRAIPLRRLGRYAEAEGVYRDFLGRWPNDTGQIRQYAGFLINQNRTQEALDLVERGLHLNASDANLEDGRALALSLLGHEAESLESARRALRIAAHETVLPGHLDFPRASVSILMEVHPEEVVGILERSVREHPGDAYSRWKLSGALLQLDRAADALAVLDQPPLAPVDEYQLINRVEALLKLERIPEAILVADQMIALAPTVPSGYLVKGRALPAGRARESIVNLERYLELAGTSTLRAPATGEKMFNRSMVAPAHRAEAHMRLGRARLELGELDAALRDLDTALTLVPEQSELELRVAILRSRAIVLATMDRHDDAVKTLDDAISLAPGNPNLRITKAYLFQPRGDWTDTIAEFRKALSQTGIDRAPIDWVEGYVEALLYADRSVEVTEEIRRVLDKREPTAPLLMVASLVLSLDPTSNEKLLARARSLAEEARTRAPNTRHSWIAMGAAHAAAGEWVQAVDVLRSAVDAPESGDDFMSRALLVRAYAHLRRVEEAGKLMNATLASPGWPGHGSPLETRLMEWAKRDLDAVAAHGPGPK